MQKIWLIGASEGIGKALSIELGQDNNNYLILSARNHERLEDLSHDIKSKKLIISLDATDKNSIFKAWKVIKEECGSIDTIIYCAGYYKPMSSDHMEIDEIEKMININLLGALKILNIIIPHFIDNRRGHIVLIGSVAGYIGLPNSIGYGASKAGVIHLAENLKCDLAKYGIKVQVINPGFVKTRLTELNKFPMPFILSPEQAAKRIINCMKSGRFESSFPYIISRALKLMSKLPYWLYFKIAQIINSNNK